MGSDLVAPVMMPPVPSSKVSRDQPKYVLDADIAGCFDHINHDALVQKLSSYPRLTQAVKAWLRAGVLEGNVFVETPSGTPQGGVISPLLANIALHGMETALIGAYPSGQQPHVVRYADDFVVLHPTEEGVQKAQARAAAWLAGMGLEMKASKTKIAHTLHPIHGQAGFNFLGFTIRQFPMGKSQTGKDGHGKPLGFKTLIKPSRGAGERASTSAGKNCPRAQSRFTRAGDRCAQPTNRGLVELLSQRRRQGNVR